MAIDWSSYPPKDHAPRIAAYKRFEQLFLGQHKEVFQIQPGRYQMLRYIVANFAGLISRLAADLLYGEEPAFLAPDENLASQEALDELVARNLLHTVNYESALSNSFRGDAVYKVRWGLRTPEAEEPEAIIEEVPASIYFPELDEDNIRQVNRVTLAWTKRSPDPQDKNTYLRIEEHEPGIIRHRVFILGGGRAVEEVSLTKFPAYEDLEPEEETGLDHIPVFHIPNFRYGSRFWGISDYDGLESLFEGLNNRVSQIDMVLDKHVAPKLVLPPGFIDDAGKIRFDAMEAVELAPGEQPPSYLTWEGQLAAAGQQYERLLDLLFILSETSPSAFGLDKFGIAESGRALKLRLLRTLAKVNRKRLYYDTALKAALHTAQILDVSRGRGGYEPQEPRIEWADGLPEDMMELVQMEAQRLASGNTSIESSVRRLDGAEAVEVEMGRIAEEMGQAVVLTGQAGGRGQTE